MEYPPEWEAQWKKDAESRAAFYSKPRSYPAREKLRRIHNLALGLLFIIALLSFRNGIYHTVPWSPALQQTYDLYEKAPISWRISHPWDAETISERWCNPGCPCVCSQNSCTPVCGEPTPGPHK